MHSLPLRRLVTGQRPPPDRILFTSVCPGSQEPSICAAGATAHGSWRPTVSYDFHVTQEVGETGAGLLVPTPHAFVNTVVDLVHDVNARKAVATPAAVAGKARDWDVLARRYEDDILDRYLT